MGHVLFLNVYCNSYVLYLGIQYIVSVFYVFITYKLWDE
jgi:hypothetical protein